MTYHPNYCKSYFNTKFYFKKGEKKKTRSKNEHSDLSQSSTKSIQNNHSTLHKGGAPEKHLKNPLAPIH